jgi:hypothetical protein
MKRFRRATSLSSSLISAARRRMERTPSSPEHSASRLGGSDPRFSGGPVREIASQAKPEGVVDLPRPDAVQADLCRGTRFVATGLHDRECQNVRRDRDGENAVSSQGAVVHCGVADAAGRERIRVAPWQITGRTGRFPLTRACAAESCLTTMLRASCAAR